MLLRIDPLWQTDLLHVPQRAQLPKARAGQKLTSQQCLDLLARSRSTTWLTNVAKLAEQLRVSTEVLEQLGVGWRWGDVGRGRDLHDGDWVYPMRDGSGQVIGVHRRLAQPYTKDGKQVGKLTVPGSTSGLFFAPDAWSLGSGPVLLVEGMTDTASLMHARQAAVGRPSNLGGSDQLAVLLEQLRAERQILVVGENDQKPDGRWPGRDGAQQTAQRLADALDRPVLWALVPGPAKDAREHITAAIDAGQEPEAAGRTLAGQLLEVATEVLPSPKDPQLDGTVPAAEPVPMEEIRKQLRHRMMQLAEPPLLQRARPDAEHPDGEPKLVPAVYLCGAPTGAGKSRAALELSQALERQGLRVAYLSQTHKQSAERLAEAEAIGLAGGAADPEITQQSCQLWHIARRVRSCGLSVSQVLCPTCPMREACSYQQAKAAAKDAPVRFACHAMGAQDLGQVAAGRDALIIDEDALGALVRHVQVRPKDVLDVLRCLRASSKSHPSAMEDADCRQALDLFTAAASALIRAVRQVREPGAVEIDTSGLVAPDPSDEDAQVRWAHKVWRIIGHRGHRSPPKDALALLLDVITGRMTEVWITHDVHATGSWDRHLVGIQRHKLPRKMVLMLDATADRSTLEQMIDASGTGWARKQASSVIVITPDGRPPDHHLARRLVPGGGDVLVGSTAERATEVLRGAMARIPEQRLGLICHGQHLDQMCGRQAEGDGLLDDAEMRRLARVAGHHTADVRGSNSWIGGDAEQRLDALVVLGCPNVPPSTVRLRLLATGHHAAAAMPHGGWQRHQVLSTAPGGRAMTNPTSASTHPVWQEARRQLVHAALHQEASRARHTLPGGVPVYVVTCEPMPGMLTEPDALVPIDEQTHYLVQEVARLSAPDTGEDLGNLHNPGSNPARDKSLKDIYVFRGNDPRKPSVSTAHLISHLEGLGWCSRTAKRALATASRAGLLQQPGTGMWSLPVPEPAPVPPQAPASPEPRQEPKQEPLPPQVHEHQQGVDVRPADRPALVVRTTWTSSPSTSTSVVVTMPDVSNLPGHYEPPRISLGRSSPAYRVQEVVQPRPRPPADPDPKALAWLSACTADQFAAWQEAAAIAEYDGGLPRRQAEIIALAGMFGRSQLAPDRAAIPPPVSC